MNKRDTIARIKKLIEKVYPHFDKVVMWADADLSFLDMERLTNFDTKKPLKPVLIHNAMSFNSGQKYQLTLFQPSPKNIQYLCDAITTESVNIFINYAEVTYDFITSEPMELTSIINNNLVYIRSTTKKKNCYHYHDKYKSPIKRTYYWGNRNLNHDFFPVTYSDKPSKIAQQPCAHLEFKISTKSTCEYNRLSVPSDLLRFDFVRFFEQHANFYVTPSKSVIGRALAAENNITNKSDRWFEEIFKKRVKEKINIFDSKPRITSHDSVQELLSKIPALKEILHTKANKKTNSKFTKEMHNAFLQKLLPVIK